MDRKNTQECCDCGKVLTFEDFLEINPNMSIEKANKLWRMPKISKYCVNCFLERPKKPYKNRSRRYSYYKFKKANEL
jgi:hypothetical protein